MFAFMALIRRFFMGPGIAIKRIYACPAALVPLNGASQQAR